MSNKISQHPSLHHSQDINDICRPLHLLNMSYFSHVRIDKNNQFSAICSNPGFTEHYLKNQYYNADIHMANDNLFGDYVIWDAIPLTGQSQKLSQEAMEFGINTTFTIIKNGKDSKNFYHFAANHASKEFNQVCLSNIDLLKLFISHFNNEVSQSKILSSSYDFRFGLDPNAEGFKTAIHENLADIKNIRNAFLREINTNTQHDAILLLSAQKKKCLELLVMGHSTKQIANKLNLSKRTVEHYLDKIREVMNCQNSKELISVYFSAMR
jgi:DNA-binding CsgD family transcriptional regulator